MKHNPSNPLPQPLPEREAVEGSRRIQLLHDRQLKQTAKDIITTFNNPAILGIISFAVRL